MAVFAALSTNTTTPTRVGGQCGVDEAAKEMANRFEYLIQSILLIGSLCIEVVKHKEKDNRVYAI